MNENNITGRPVAIANTDGIIIPSPALIAIGINIPKNNTALNGQNATVDCLFILAKIS